MSIADSRSSPMTQPAGGSFLPSAEGLFLVFTFNERGRLSLVAGRGRDCLEAETGTPVEEVLGSDATVRRQVSGALQGATSSTPLRFGRLELSSQFLPLRDEKERVYAVVGLASDPAPMATGAPNFEKLSAAVNQIGDSIIITDRDGKIEYVNHAFEQMTGYSASEVLGRSPRVLKSDTHPSHFYRNLWNTILAGHDFRATFANRKKSGELYYEDRTITPIKDGEGQISHFVSAGRDITRRRRAEEAQARLSAILEATPDLVAITGLDGRLRHLNAAGRAMLGLSQAPDLSETSLAELRPPWARSLFLETAIPTALRDGSWSGESAFTSAEGKPITVSEVLIAHRSKSGIESLSCIARDISERKQLEAHLTYQAEHDPLTDLLNRRRFHEELSRCLAQGARSEIRGAVVLLDLDEFKYINDTLGHRAGDEFLVSVARVLSNRIRDVDLLARLGGDEFSLLIPNANGEEVLSITKHMLEAVRQHVVTIAGRPVHITGSAGIALFPDHGSSPEELIARADLAMYQAKSHGRDGIALYSPTEDWPTVVEKRLTGQAQIREALEKGLFVLHAQPILELRTDCIVQYELLLRMESKDGEMVMPSTLLGIAERFGLIRAIDRWVVREAIRMINERAQAGEELRLAVNLSAKSFTDPDFAQVILDALGQGTADPRLLSFEVTETAAIADFEQARAFMNRLRVVGCRFALDDFGVGFSSLYHLKHLPVDDLKIDGAFVASLPHNTVDQHLVKAIVEVARGLQKRTIAEFVGDDETLGLLRDFGIDFAQGYHIGRPRPVSELLEDRTNRHR